MQLWLEYYEEITFTMVAVGKLRFSSREKGMKVRMN